MSRKENDKQLSYEVPWPRELSQGMAVARAWAVVSFILFLVEWYYGLIAIVMMFIYLQQQRRTPVGKARIHFSQGRLAYRKKNWEKALSEFNKVLEIMPQAAAVYPTVGDLYFTQGDMSKFKKAYQQYFQLQPDDHHMKMWYAGKFMEVGNFGDAAKELKKLPSEMKKDIQVANLLAVCLIKSDQANEAVKVLEPVALKNEDTDEQDLSARYFLAKAYILTEQKEKARHVLKRLEESAPGFEDVPDLIKELG